jgi:hypothetical protein
MNFALEDMARLFPLDTTDTSDTGDPGEAGHGDGSGTLSSECTLCDRGGSERCVQDIVFSSRA